MPDPILISPFLSGNTSFAGSDTPQLTSGDYVLTASTQAAGTGITSNKSFSQTLSFSVAGPRFRLQESDIVILSPADESLADNQNTLPSVYFSRSTLPWERTPVQNIAGEGPWLAIVLVTEAESAHYSVSNMPLSNFLPQNQWESTDDPNEIVTVLSLNYDLGNAILPLYTDLQWLAHVRYMEAENNENLLRRAVVLGTRLPVAGIRNTCFLVSIENCYANQTLIQPAGGANFQLAVLKSWSFTNTSPDYDFEGLMTAPSMAPVSVRLPEVQTIEGTIDPEPWLANGYVLLPSYYRTGESSAAWYHGPLTPGGDNTQLPLPTLSPDSLQIFDTQTGVMDAGYAAAWELGRLISLANAGYTQSLYSIKQASNIRQVQLGQTQTTNHLPIQNTQTVWNWISANQTAMFRLNEQVDDSKWTNLVDGNAYGMTTGQPYLRLNDAFGCSPALTVSDSITLQLVNIGSGSGLGFSFWVFLAHESEGEQTLATLYDASNETKTIRVFAQGTNVFIRCGNGANSGAAYPIAQGWHQIGVSVYPYEDSFTAALYLDGNMNTQAPITEGRLSLNNVILGNEPEGTQPAPGQYANVRMSKEPLGEAHYQALYGYDRSFQPIFQHLNNLKCLKGLPFSYLVPDANMVPPESLRFFELGAPWLAALLDGATSLGRISERQLVADADLQNFLGMTLPGKATGILLRSAVVNAYPTLEIEGYSVAANGTDPMPADAQLPILRREILSQDLIFILFLGELVTLDIHPHSETLHYGVFGTTPDIYSMYYRNAQGQEMPVGQSPTLVYQGFRNTIYRTLDLDALSLTLIPYTGISDFNSGTMGMELLQGGQLVRYNLQNN